MDNKKCYLCDSNQLRKREGKVRNDDSLDILECVRCGLVFLSSFDHLREDFYSASEQHVGEPEGMDIDRWVNETEIDDERRCQTFKSVLENKRVLDFGCGTGNFLLKIQKFAKDAVGVESEKRLQEHYRKNGLQIFSALSEIPEEKTFNVITLFHVLEHFVDPISMLQNLSKKLSGDGRIIVEVPNIDDALLTLYQSDAFSSFTYWKCHPFLYNISSLSFLAKKAQLKIHRIHQVQRYPLSNHLHWLALGKPGGHKEWSYLDSPELKTAYQEKLRSIDKCDTIIATFSL